jgi:hypothetical protein
VARAALAQNALFFPSSNRRASLRRRAAMLALHTPPALLPPPPPSACAPALRLRAARRRHRCGCAAAVAAAAAPRRALRCHASSSSSSDAPQPPAAAPAAAGPASGLERLRASLNAPGGLPFLTDASLVAEDVVYEGPLATLSGRDAYLAAQRDWAAALPARLPGWRCDAPTLFPLDAGRSLRLRYAPRFAARLPPRAAERLVQAGEAPLPEDAARSGFIAAKLNISADISLDASGRVVRHTERVTDGFDVAATIARYEYLTARRRGDLPPVWYYKVLRATSLEEAAAAAGTAPDEPELQAGFAAMVARNFGAGLLLGAAALCVCVACLCWRGVCMRAVACVLC